MAATSTPTTTLRMYINDMAALERHIFEALEKQKEDERVKADPQVSALIQRIHTTVRANMLTMENHAAAAGGETGAAIKEAITTVAGTLAGLYDKVRKHPVSRMLRDDYTALSLAATGYSMLHTTALAFRELPVANVALRHLKEVTPLVMELSRIIPMAVVSELAEDNPDIDRSVAQLASENTLDAWGSAKS